MSDKVMNSVSSVPDDELLRRSVRFLMRRGRGRYRAPLWSVVSKHFALGSGYSCELCRRFGLDPDQMVKS